MDRKKSPVPTKCLLLQFSNPRTVSFNSISCKLSRSLEWSLKGSRNCQEQSFVPDRAIIIGMYRQDNENTEWHQLSHFFTQYPVLPMKLLRGNCWGSFDQCNGNGINSACLLSLLLFLSSWRCCLFFFYGFLSTIHRLPSHHLRRQLSQEEKEKQTQA